MDNLAKKLDDHVRFLAAMKLLEWKNDEFDIFDLLSQPEPILKRLIERFRQSKEMIDGRTLSLRAEEQQLDHEPHPGSQNFVARPKQAVVVELWEAAQFVRASGPVSIERHQKRLSEIELFCTRAAYQLAMPEKHVYREATQRNADPFIATAIKVLWPLWRMTPSI